LCFFSRCQCTKKSKRLELRQEPIDPDAMESVMESSDVLDVDAEVIKLLFIIIIIFVVTLTIFFFSKQGNSIVGDTRRNKRYLYTNSN
jgi:hypothetical protein